MGVSDVGPGTCSWPTKSIHRLRRFCVICVICGLAYLRQGGNVFRADFSFFNPRAQSACINV